MRIKFYGNMGWMAPNDEHSCFSILNDSVNILFDAGSPKICELENVSLDAIFLTHVHLDHIKNLTSLLGFMHLQGRTEPLKIYTPQPLFGEKGIPYNFIPECFFHQLKFKINVIVTKKKSSVNIKNIDVFWTQLIQEVPSTNVPVNVYSINHNKLLFITDIGFKQLEKLDKTHYDILICDADGSQPGPAHLCPEDVGNLINKIKPYHAILTHFNIMSPEAFKNQCYNYIEYDLIKIKTNNVFLIKNKIDIKLATPNHEFFYDGNKLIGEKI